MKINLEQLTKKSFEDYCKKNNTICNWYLLPTERKLAWANEILDLFEIVVNNINLDIKPVPAPKIGLSSIEMGLNEGIRSERQRLKQQLNELLDNLNNQYNNLKGK